MLSINKSYCCFDIVIFYVFFCFEIFNDLSIRCYVYIGTVIQDYYVSNVCFLSKFKKKW